MAPRTGAEIFIDGLVAEGVEYMFGVPGNEMLDIIDAAYRRGKPRFILNHGEAAASYCAVGYGNFKGAPAVCLGAEGPGAANMLTGVAAAFKTYVPMIAVSGKHKRFELEKDTNHETDTVTLFQSVTKWSYMPPCVEKMGEATRKAFRMVLSGRAGPVHLTFPEDLLGQKTDVPDLSVHRYRPLTKPACDPAAVERALEMLSDASSPVLLAGRELLDERVSEMAGRFAEAFGLPIVNSAEHMDAVPTVHPLCMGPMGIGGGWKPANTVARRADVVLALGVKFDYRTTKFSHDYIPENARIIQVSGYPEHIGMNMPIEMDVVGSARSFLEQALALVQKSGRKGSLPADMESLKRAWTEDREAAADPTAMPIKSQYVARTTRRLMEPDGIAIVDSGNFSKHIRENFYTVVPNSYDYLPNYGSVGASLPRAMGARLAEPHRQVVCFTGDGGFLMYTTEIETAVREGIKITVVVFNDYALGNTRSVQLRKYGGRVTGVTFGRTDIAALVRSMGGHGERVTEPQELEPALRRALAADVCAVVDVATDPGDTVLVQ